MTDHEQAYCQMCGTGLLRPTLETANLRLSRCHDCGHRLASHAPSEVRADYHHQYDEGDFLNALRATRHRQAALILRNLSALAPSAKRLLDVGCGRAWFLDTAREIGFQVAGADTSRVAVELVAQHGMPSVLLGTDSLVPAGLPFRPSVVALLDVVEHLPPERLGAALAEIRSAFAPELEILVVKVPVASGVLYRAAEAVARLGSSGLLEQLYQVGTVPPHQSYFSSGSLRKVLERGGFGIVAEVRDLDFEPDRLADRAHSLRGLPRALVAVAAQMLARLALTFGAQDSTIMFAKPV